MTTLSHLTYTPSDESVIHQLTALPLLADAELFETAEHCAALVSVLVETDDEAGFTALGERLLHGLRQLRELCDADLPPYLVAQLIVGEKVTSCVPECWQETALQVDYAQTLTQALLAGTLPPGVAFRLHPGTISEGCITIAHNSDYALIRYALLNTSPVQVPCQRSLMALGWVEVINTYGNTCL